MTAVLGISAFYHDSAAALIVDGKIIAAAQEERFSRVKHDASFPSQAIAFCLSAAGMTASDLELVAYYEKPFLKFERILESHLAIAPRGFMSFLRSMPIWVKQKLLLRREIKNALPGYSRQIVFPEHHQSHAVSAFFASPFEEAAILTIDGVGEWATTCWGKGKGHRVELNGELRFPHSVGLLYSTLTAFCGFRVNGGEGKLMGLAPYGEPQFYEAFRDQLIDLKDDGSFRLDLSYFDFLAGKQMWSRKFEKLVGGKRRIPESEITRREKDLAASIQLLTEEILLHSAKHVHQQTGVDALCLAGGVALNCVANGRLLRESPFNEVWVQPAPGDSGGALGAALFASCQLLEIPVEPDQTPFLGPLPSGLSQSALQQASAISNKEVDDNLLCQELAKLLTKGKIVGWIQGPMEFGPRALGNRSILADSRQASMKDLVNQRIKFRENFRPFAPAVMEEHTKDYFELESSSPWMTFAAPVQPEKREVIAAVTHVDGSARVQTVSKHHHPRFYELLAEFHRLTGVPVLLNTSFNLRGEPIVCTADDAMRCFLKSGLDVLVIGNQIWWKETPSSE